MSALVRLAHWFFDPLPARRDAEEGSGALAIWVTVFACASFLIGEHHGLPKTTLPLEKGAWRMLVHLAIPLAGVAGWELVRTGKQRILGLLAMAIALGTVGLRWAREGLLAGDWRVSALPTFAVLGLVLLGLKRAEVPLERWSLGLGDWRWWIPRTLAIIAVMVPVIFAAVWLFPSLAAFYPTWKPARTSHAAFAELHFAIFLDFLGWEYIFRAFLLDAIWKRGDALLAILFQAVPYFILHGNKPQVEMISSLLGGILAGWFCLRARSSLPMVCIHWTVMAATGLAAQALRAWG